MTPIEKNIHVRNENGNELEPTWPKRARGLVKSGRARFVSEDTIILTPSEDAKRTLPPNMEDNKMPETAYNDKATEIAVVDDTPRGDSQENKSDSRSSISVEEILDRIGAIIRDQEALRNAVDNIQAITSGGGNEPGSPGDIAGQAKAQAIADMIRCRETTVQKTLDFYMKIYEDLKPTMELNHKTAMLGMINDTVLQLNGDPDVISCYLNNLVAMGMTF